MDLKGKAAAVVTALVALGVGGGVTYAAGQHQADTVTVRTVSDATTPEQPSASPSDSPSASPSTVASPEPAQASAPVDSAPAPKPKTETTVTQPKQDTTTDTAAKTDATQAEPTTQATAPSGSDAISTPPPGMPPLGPAHPRPIPTYDPGGGDVPGQSTGN